MNNNDYFNLDSRNPDSRKNCLVFRDLVLLYLSSSLICITETWLCSDIQSNNIEINGFYSMRLDRCLEERGKKKGGGLCIYVNKQWCSNITNRSSISSKDIELMCVSFRPFYLPREFPQVNVLLVYIPPSSDKENAKQIIQEQVNELGIQSADAPVIILGDFNHCDLENCYAPLLPIC